MPKISRNLSTILSLSLAAFFFVCCIIGLFLLPALTEALIRLRGLSHMSSLEHSLCLVSAYAIVLDMMLADGMLFTLLLKVRKGEVFTDGSVSLIRGVSWCCMGLCIPFGYLGLHFQLAFLVCFLAIFLGLSLRVCKNAFEEATRIKQENDLTV